MINRFQSLSFLWILPFTFFLANCGGGSDSTVDKIPGESHGNDDASNIGPDLSKVDTDKDGLNDAAEIARGSDPKNPDSDDDTLRDGDEVAMGSSPINRNSDCEGAEDANDPVLSKLSEFVMDTSDASNWRAYPFNDHIQFSNAYTLPSFPADAFLIGLDPSPHSFAATYACSNAGYLVGSAGGAIWGNPNCVGGAFWYRGEFRLPELRATKVRSLVLEHLAADDSSADLRFNGRDLLGLVNLNPRTFPMTFAQSLYGWVAPEHNKIVVGIRAHDSYAPVGALALRMKAIYEHFYSVDHCPAP